MHAPSEALDRPKITAYRPPAPTPTGAADPKPATNDFIVRAAAAEINGIASRNGLTVVSQIAAATDEDGHGLFLLRDDSGTALPKTVLQNVRDLEPDAAGIEEVFLASLPKLNQSTAVILDTSGCRQPRPRFRRVGDDHP